MNELNLIQYIDDKYFDGKAGTILDVACGDGKFLESLQKTYQFTAIGMDIDLNILKEARKRSIESTRFLYGDMFSFQLNRTFDIITCFDAIDHDPRLVENMDKILVNFYRHLNAKGVLVFSMPLNIGKAVRINKTRVIAQKLGFQVSVLDAESTRIWKITSRREPVFLCLKGIK